MATFSRKTHAEVIGKERVVLHLRQMRHNILDQREAMNQIGIAYRRDMNRQFRSNGAYLGHSQWKPLSKNTNRLVNHNRAQLLQDTGGLKRSWTVKGAKGNVSRINRVSAEFGSRYRADQRGRQHKSMPIAMLHQEGTSSMSARVVLTIPASLRKEMADRIAEHIVEPFQ